MVLAITQPAIALLTLVGRVPNASDMAATGSPSSKRMKYSLPLRQMRSSSQLAGNVVALGKRYSDDIYISFEQAISTTTEYLVKLDYALTQRISLRGQTGTTSGVGVFYRYSWD